MNFTQCLALAGLLCILVAFFRATYVLNHDAADETPREDRSFRDLIVAWMLCSLLLQVVALIAG